MAGQVPGLQCLEHTDRVGGRQHVSRQEPLCRAGQLKPGLVVLGHGLVQQCAFGVARVVEFGFGTRLSARMRMRLR